MLLAIGTAHRACSLALIDGDKVMAERHDMIGRGHAELLVPMIEQMLDGRRPQALLCEIGPGSFTGIRIGLAAARALALAWQIPLAGMTSTALLAAEAFDGAAPPGRLCTLLDGGRGEVFVQHFTASGAEDGLSVVPADAFETNADALIGTGASMVRATVPILSEAPPRAAYARLLPPKQRDLPPRPIYLRAPDAKLPVAR